MSNDDNQDVENLSFTQALRKEGFIKTESELNTSNNEIEENTKNIDDGNTNSTLNEEEIQNTDEKDTSGNAIRAIAVIIIIIILILLYLI